MAVTGWAAWRGRQLLIGMALTTGTLLFCDAWFDVVLDWNTDDRWGSILSAVVVEIPLALLLIVIARRGVKRTIALTRARIGLSSTDDMPSLTHMRLFDPILPATTTPPGQHLP